MEWHVCTNFQRVVLLRMREKNNRFVHPHIAHLSKIHFSFTNIRTSCAIREKLVWTILFVLFVSVSFCVQCTFHLIFFALPIVHPTISIQTQYDSFAQSCLKNLCLIIITFFRSMCDPADRPVRPSVHRPPQQRFSSDEKCAPSDGTSDKKPATVTNAAVQPTSTEYHCHKRFGAFTFHKTSFSESSVGSWW